MYAVAGRDAIEGGNFIVGKNSVVGRDSVVDGDVIDDGDVISGRDAVVSCVSVKGEGDVGNVVDLCGDAVKDGVVVVSGDVELGVLFEFCVDLTGSVVVGSGC